MSQLFRPLGADPLAPRADTWPYFHNICQYLSHKDANLYRSVIEHFEKGEISEATLGSLIGNSGIFQTRPDVQYLHDDLIIVMLMNKVAETLRPATNIEPAKGRATSSQPAHEDTTANIGSGEETGDKINAEYEANEEVEGIEGNVKWEPKTAINSSLGQHVIDLAAPAAVTPGKVASKPRSKSVRKAVGSYEKTNLAKEAESFLAQGKRTTKRTSQAAGMNASRKKPRVDYNEQ